MAKILGEMELTDHNKSSLVESGVLDLLLILVSHDAVEMKIVAVQALLNLSSLKRNGQEMIKKGVVRPLLDILYRQTSSQRLRELVAATIVHLALSTVPQDSNSTPVLMLESDEDISELCSFISLTSPPLQQKILQAFHAMCLSPSAAIVKSKLREVRIEILYYYCLVLILSTSVFLINWFFLYSARLCRCCSNYVRLMTSLYVQMPPSC